MDTMDTMDTNFVGNLIPCVDCGESGDGIDKRKVHTFLYFASKSQKMRVLVSKP